jgi:Flp pilus assembly protein TadD
VPSGRRFPGSIRPRPIQSWLTEPGAKAWEWFLRKTNDNKEAFEYLQRALKPRPAYPAALNNLGVLYLRTERRDQAVASFEECIRVAPAFDQPYLNLAKSIRLEGDRRWPG